MRYDRNAKTCCICGKSISNAGDRVYVGCVARYQTAHWRCAESENRVFAFTPEQLSAWDFMSSAQPQTHTAARPSMKIGYARVAGKDVLETQLEALINAGCGRIFSDATSGIKRKRPEFDAMISTIRHGDEVIACKADRLGRTMVIAVGMMKQIMAAGATITFLDDPGLSTSQQNGDFVMLVLDAVVRYELGLIADRTNAGVISARKRGKHIGRPTKLTPRQQSALVNAIQEGRMTIADAARHYQVSYPTAHRLATTTTYKDDDNV